MYSESAKAFGHPNASVLNGGLLGWSAAGGELDTDTATPAAEMDIRGHPSSAYPIPPLNEGAIRSKRSHKLRQSRNGRL